MENQKQKLVRLLKKADNKTRFYFSLISKYVLEQHYDEILAILQSKEIEKLLPIIKESYQSRDKKQVYDVLQSIEDGNEIYELIVELNPYCSVMSVLKATLFGTTDYTAKILERILQDKRFETLSLKEYDRSPFYGFSDAEKLACLKLLASDECYQFLIIDADRVVNGCRWPMIGYFHDEDIRVQALKLLSYDNFKELCGFFSQEDIDEHDKGYDGLRKYFSELRAKLGLPPDDNVSSFIKPIEDKIDLAGRIDFKHIGKYYELFQENDFFEWLAKQNADGKTILHRKNYEATLEVLKVVDKKDWDKVLNAENSEGLTVFENLESRGQNEVIKMSGGKIKANRYSLHGLSSSEIVVALKLLAPEECTKAMLSKDKEENNLFAKMVGVYDSHYSDYRNYGEDEPWQRADDKAAADSLASAYEVQDQIVEAIRLVPKESRLEILLSQNGKYNTWTLSDCGFKRELVETLCAEDIIKILLYKHKEDKVFLHRFTYSLKVLKPLSCQQIYELITHEDVGDFAKRMDENAKKDLRLIIKGRKQDSFKEKLWELIKPEAKKKGRKPKPVVPKVKKEKPKVFLKDKVMDALLKK